MAIKKVPFEYVHPNKKKDTSGAVEVLDEPTKATLPVVPKTSVRTNEDTVVIRLLACPPQPDQIEIYDKMMADGLTPKEAVLGLITREFLNFHKAMMDSQQTVPDGKYVPAGKAIETTRTGSAALFEAARLRFDPYGVLSKRALGQKMGQSIIQLAGLRGSDPAH